MCFYLYTYISTSSKRKIRHFSPSWRERSERSSAIVAAEGVMKAAFAALGRLVVPHADNAAVEHARQLAPGHERRGNGALEGDLVQLVDLTQNMIHCSIH